MDRSNILKAIDDAKRVVATCPTWKRKSDCVSRSMNDCLTAADALALSRRIERLEQGVAATVEAIEGMKQLIDKIVSCLEKVADRNDGKL